MKKHLEILEMADNKQLPKSIDETTDFPLDIITELVKADYLKAADLSTEEEVVYYNTKITLSGREYLEHLKDQERENSTNMEKPNIRLFICHSAADQDLVEKLLELIRSALELPAVQIRCTSIEGHRLPVGAKTDERLRQEVHEADAFVGIISTNSLQSLYVAFELGARWGAGKSLFPVLAPGTDASILEGPLAGLNALSAANRQQLHQLISDLANTLDVKSEKPEVYGRYVEAVLNLPEQAVLITNNPEKVPVDISLPPECTKILQIIAEEGDFNLTSTQISADTGENITRTQYYLDQLLERKFIHNTRSLYEPTKYGLLTAGRAYLVENELI
jgi:hypothetical protein